MPRLKTRLTWRYSGFSAWLDEWADVGGYELIHQELISQDLDSAYYEFIAEVKPLPGRTRRQVMRALEDSLSDTGCECSHDCCGCISTYTEATHIYGNFYLVAVTLQANV